MSEQFPNPGNSSFFGRARNRYNSWDRWAQIATIASPVVALIAAVAPIELSHSGSGASSGTGQAARGDHISLPSSTPAAAIPGSTPLTDSPPAAATAGPGGIPAADLGTWGGQVAQVNGINDRFFLNLNEPGTPGSPDAVGTFNNQTGDCQGNVFLDGVSGGTLVDLRLETTQDPGNDCTTSVEADVELAPGGSALDYEVITAGTAQGSLQSPLAEGSLFH